MITNDKTRYVAVNKHGTRELNKIGALLALANDEADYVLVMQAEAEGGVSLLKWELTKNAP